MIPESFAKCLGGLAMIVNKTLKLKILASNGCVISKSISCLQGYKSEKSENNLECKIQVDDIQFAEASIPKVYSEKTIHQWHNCQGVGK